MSWPTLQDYSEAIQSPRTAFADAELKLGTPETNNLGLPKPVSGQFATVYTVRCGSQRYAVRCFAKEIPDIYERYDAISQRLQQVKLRQIVNFQFLREGIRVSGKWYPIIKMEWVQGELLPRYVERNLANSQALVTLARRFIELFQDLQGASIAHGDLQHGNIVVKDGELRLIDYDGMFVPSLAGRKSNETGHRNYQHPLRSGFDYGPGMDAFSAWVIYVSLIALSQRPQLWQAFGGGDECLLFRREDFEKPEASKLIAALEKDPSIGDLVSLFRSLLYLGPAQIPPLDGKTITFPSTRVSSSVTSQNGAASDLWWKDHQPSAVFAAAAAAARQREPASSPAAISFDSSWVLDFIEHPSAPTPQDAGLPSCRDERLILLASIVVLVATAVFGRAILPFELAFGAWLAVLGTNIVWWRVRFEKLPGVSAMRTLDTRIGESSRRVRAARQEMQGAEKAAAGARNGLANAEKAAATSITALANREREELERARRASEATLSQLRIKRTSLAKQEADALQRLASSLGAQRASIQRQIQEIDAAWQSEVSNRLAALQREHVFHHLRGAYIEIANIPGLSPTLKIALRVDGMTTAEDVSFARVQRTRGFGDKRTSAVMNWRREIENAARLSAPTSLSRDEEQQIASRFVDRKTKLNVELDRLTQSLQSEEFRVRDQFRQATAPIDQQIAQAVHQGEQAMNQVRATFALERSRLETANRQRVQDALAGVRQAADLVHQTQDRLLPLQWDHAKLSRQMRKYDLLRFSNFMRRIVLLPIRSG